MFEIKLYLNNEIKEFYTVKDEKIVCDIECKTSNTQYEILYANVRIIKCSGDTISLTDKSEFFRFLPINRNNILFCIAIPDSENEFLKYIENYVCKIQYIRFIKHNKFTSVIIYFEDQDSADNFYYEYNTKSFKSNNEYLYVIFILRIFILSDENKNDNFVGTELPSCPLCLEKIDEVSTGIHTISNILCSNRWELYKKYCQVCSKFQSENKCKKCDISTNIWCCMICGFIGCDRYQNVHSKFHFEETRHRYSIDLNTHRIWDYIDDTWVHRILKIKDEEINNTIFFENREDSLSSKEYLTRVENIISEYNYVLSTQLEEQRMFYEKEINKMEDLKMSDSLMLNEKITNLKEEIKKKKTNIENCKKLIKEYHKKQNTIKLEKYEENIKLNKELINNVKSDIERELSQPVIFIKTGFSEF